MKRATTIRHQIAALVVATVAPSSAFAYLDPGTGSFILQMVIAGALGAMLYVKLAWARTKDFFDRLLSSPKAEISPEVTEHAAVPVRSADLDDHEK